MIPTAVWRVMTPIRDRHGAARWFRPLIVARYEHEAARIADQIAGAYGFTFDDDIAMQRVSSAFDGSEVVV